MSQRQFSHQTILNILDHWSIDPIIQTSPHQGLINHTWLIGAPTQGVLQWVNPIFDPRVHDDIHALTTHLASKGLVTTTLRPTTDGRHYVADSEGGYWRLLSFVPGLTFDTIQDTDHAFAAGALVGQFHNALSDFEHEWQAPFRDSHNTPIRMQQLTEALEHADGHPLEGPARELGNAILNDWTNWQGTLELPIRSTHGDLKISNLHFTRDLHSHQIQGLCLLDLDTIGKGDYSVEMGDAWRSWCNPAGESNVSDTHFDLNFFEASARGWLSTVGHLEPIEVQNLGPGIQRICLELAARFCTDAILNTYFKEDRQTHPQIGTQNLLRAKSQYKLATSVKTQLLQIEERLHAILN
jgi:hypothetical protein